MDFDVDQDDFGVIQALFGGQGLPLTLAGAQATGIPDRNSPHPERRIPVQAKPECPFAPAALELALPFLNGAAENGQARLLPRVAPKLFPSTKPPRAFGLAGIIVVLIIIDIIAILSPWLYGGYKAAQAWIFQAQASYATSQDGDRIREALDLLKSKESMSAVVRE